MGNHLICDAILLSSAMRSMVPRNGIAIRTIASRRSPSVVRTSQCRCKAFTTTRTKRADAARTSKSLELAGSDWFQTRCPPLPIKDGVSVNGKVDEAGNGAWMGYIGKQRKVGKDLIFADLRLPEGGVIQLAGKGRDAVKQMQTVNAHSPVVIHGRVENQQPEPGEKQTVELTSVKALNQFPSEIIVTDETNWLPSQRHLQFRFDEVLRARLEFRSWLESLLSWQLRKKRFTSVHTPTMFKPTAEGAREFLVPTREKGQVYALTQSPQQYKQVLVANGIFRYSQWARCYRDEDGRADRQPEFTQLDLEWAFAGRETVLRDVQDMIEACLSEMLSGLTYKDLGGKRIPVEIAPNEAHMKISENVYDIVTLTYAEAIERYGIDKPDLRIPGQISQLDVPDSGKHFVSMITKVEDPLVEACVLSVSEDVSPSEVQKFIFEFLEQNPKLMDGPSTPAVLVFDTSKPYFGFSSLGPEYDTFVPNVDSLNEGDVVIIAARPQPNDTLYVGGATQ